MTAKIDSLFPHVRIHTVIDGCLIASKGYSIFKSKDMGKTWILQGTLPVPVQKVILSKIRFISRGLRTGIHQITTMHNGKIIICCSNEFYLSDTSLANFERIELHSRFYQILDHNICVTPHFTYFGEYFRNVERNPVTVFRTGDGKTWTKIFSFPKKSVKHIHLLQYDPYFRKIWFSTGDSDSECLLGYSDPDFSHVEIVGRNHQDWRCLELLFTPEKIFWGTDNPEGQNWLMALDRNSGVVQKLKKFNGPVYNLKQFSKNYMILTATEGGGGELDNRAHVWLAADPEKGSWTDYLSFQKDYLPFKFGYGRLFFGAELNNTVYLWGSSLSTIDNTTIAFSFDKNVP